MLQKNRHAFECLNVERDVSEPLLASHRHRSDGGNAGESYRKSDQIGPDRPVRSSDLG